MLEQRWGFQLGSDVVYADPGDLVYKPRDVWHMFWNATDRPARVLEIISPSGFEQLFVELDELLKAGDVEGADAFGREVRCPERPLAAVQCQGPPRCLLGFGILAYD